MENRRENLQCSAVILSGGLNSRMGGRNKAFLKVGGKTILERLRGTLEGLFREILLVTRQPELYEGQGLTVVEDIYEDRASLTGLHAGLTHAKGEYALMVPCDAPFLDPALIRLLLSAVEPGVDVIVPRFEKHYEPLCAIYSKRCLPHIEAQLDRGNYRIFDFFEHINLKVIDGHQLKKADGDLLSFFNVNTPEALARSLAVAAGKD